ncbi:2-oxoacid:acceptor oxidoreductase subunit alpha [Thermovibrio ammonificans]|uniref:Pyruvate flavodoxin/ferredoxin oxidoreductase domain protein n=1 Tax=Thermovibrio ammonificans (strain DSM 15698 / JCM 12110 / HB-1) TaxID=648996 RepID=E8T3T4_THEA1|nr:2-oxoacid:acceptor oxidoreductase subunit alpha [Thermovibrio ammonificans]ADU97341.1 pyruvate flavodoxin/ferredoxin oxidoreductase domain protein [Thermovibrio ammonificans HB-1]
MERSVIIGGQAGEGIKEAANLLAKVLVNLGYSAFTYHDYPSLIRGGHNFSQVRFSNEPVAAPVEKADYIVALDERSVKEHLKNAKESTVWIVDEAVSSVEGIKLPLRKLAKGVMRSSAILGALLKAFRIERSAGEAVIEQLPQPEENKQVFNKSYDLAPEVEEIVEVEGIKGTYISGSEATALGAVDGGLNVYIAYPMTPASPVLHYLAAHKREFGIKVVQPENEIGVINMVLGAAYAGGRAMTGTSGGGFALMTETLSLAGMSETPVVIYEAQRGAPSTGVPTYTEQADLLFALFAGHGDFQRIVVAPSSARECYLLTREALNLAWKFQVPVIILTSKNVAESFFTEPIERERVVEEPKLWNGEGTYKRYTITEDGISPLAFPGTKGAVVKSNSYEHDEVGITTERPEVIRAMKEKRERKRQTIYNYFKDRSDTVTVGGDTNSNRVLVTWGENWGVCCEVGEELGYKAVKPNYLEPFPAERLKQELQGAREIIAVELSITGQFEKLLKLNGIEATRRFRKYDTRPIFKEELTRFLRGER